MPSHPKWLLAVVLIAGLAGFLVTPPAQANIIYRSQCVAPLDCSGDTAFNVEFEFLDTIVGGTTITAFSSLFVQWRASSSVGNGFTISGTAFPGPPTETLFGFSSDLSSLSVTAFQPFVDLREQSIGAVQFKFDSNNGVHRTLDRIDGLPVNVNDPKGIDFVLTRVPTPVPVPPTILLLVAGISGMVLIRWRREKTDVSSA